MNSLEEAVSRTPEIMSGALVFAGTRVPVRTLFDCLEGGHPLAEFIHDFPSVTLEQAKVVIAESGRQIVKRHSSSSTEMRQ